MFFVSVGAASLGDVDELTELSSLRLSESIFMVCSLSGSTVGMFVLFGLVGSRVKLLAK